MEAAAEITSETNSQTIESRGVGITGKAEGSLNGAGREKELEGSSALLALDVNLAHNQLRQMIEAVYRDKDRLSGCVKSLERENERLRHEAESRRETFASAAEERGADVARLQHELFASQQLNQELANRHEAAKSEVAQMKLALESSESTIKELEEQLAKTNAKEQSLGSATFVSTDELKRMADEFARRERQVYSNLEYVRKASGSVQEVTTELIAQLPVLRREIARQQQEQAEYKAIIESHSCVHEHSKSGQSVASGAHVCAEKTKEQAERIDNLQQQVLALELERDSLQLRCQSLSADIDVVQHQLDESAKSNAAQQVLLVRYEQSSREGTQTIDGLQESLLAICKQLDDERVRHRREMQEVQSASSSISKNTEAELAKLHERIRAMEHEGSVTEATLAIKIAKDNLRQALEADDTSYLPNLQQACVEGIHNGKVCKQSAICYGSTSSKGPRWPSGNTSIAKKTNIATTEYIDDSDAEEISLACAETAHKNIQAARRDNRARRVNDESCISCNGKSFGFMVRCHMCHGNFHIGCTKSSQGPSKGKRKLQHVFQCKGCQSKLQKRPSKVPRKSNAPAGV